jgi:large subunit ribosomal protein L4
MPTLDVVDLNKKKVGSVDLRDNVFGMPSNIFVVHGAVRMQRACERQGTASTLKRGEVSGSGKKPWKQKHTGRARAGSLRSPVWRHGGTVFGPQPRNYAYTVPKMQYRRAMQNVLSAKLAAGEIVVVSELRLDGPKTKMLARTLEQLGLSRRTLIVAGGDRQDLALAARNLPMVTVLRPDQVNVYDVLRCDAMLVSERDVEKMQEVWS